MRKTCSIVFITLCCCLSAKAQSTLPQNFYKNFTGTVAGLEVRLILWSVNGDMNGKYFYDEDSESVYFSELSLTKKGFELVLGENIWAHQKKNLSQFGNWIILKEIYPEFG